MHGNMSSLFLSIRSSFKLRHRSVLKPRSSLFQFSPRGRTFDYFLLQTKLWHQAAILICVFRNLGKILLLQLDAKPFKPVQMTHKCTETVFKLSEGSKSPCFRSKNCLKMCPFQQDLFLCIYGIVRVRQLMVPTNTSSVSAGTLFPADFNVIETGKKGCSICTLCQHTYQDFRV